MEREIKFRGKTINGNEWIYGPTISRGTIKRKANKWYMEVAENKWKGLQPNTLGQYTGLKDKNGKEIYEGDILRGDEYPFNCDGVDNYFAEIVWADNVCGFYRLTHKKTNSTVRGISHGIWEQLDEDDIKSFEVIGNIHDNPELLKDGRD